MRRLLPHEFPPLLAEIPDPPTTLYIEGSLPPEGHRLLTVVGSRSVSRYGKDACEHLVRGLAGYPISIVSGLALGTDGIAHRAALDAGLHIIAVPGSGLGARVLYPRAHVSLAREIVESGGALLSEFEEDEPATPYSFPKRNRVMAGMSHATLVIEATQKSGTLITARLAIDYNRDLLVVPHQIFSEGGEGGHIFMKIGAAPVRCAEDILEALGIEATKKEAVAVSEKEQMVLTLLSSPMPRDELLRALKLETSEGNALLLSMELRGLIKESLGEIRRSE